MMHNDDRAAGGRGGVGAALRREAVAERPRFSEEFHERLVQRLPVASAPRTALPAFTLPANPPSPIRRAALPLAVSATLVAAAILLLALPGREAQPDRVPGPIAGGGVELVTLTPPMAARGEPGEPTIGLEQEPVGIDRLPTFDEIGESVREGVTTLAVSLLEVPEWTALADFDAGEFFSDGGR